MFILLLKSVEATDSQTGGPYDTSLYIGRIFSLRLLPAVASLLQRLSSASTLEVVPLSQHKTHQNLEHQQTWMWMGACRVGGPCRVCQQLKGPRTRTHTHTNTCDATVSSYDPISFSVGSPLLRCEMQVGKTWLPKRKDSFPWQSAWLSKDFSFYTDL